MTGPSAYPSDRSRSSWAVVAVGGTVAAALIVVAIVGAVIGPRGGGHPAATTGTPTTSGGSGGSGGGAATAVRATCPPVIETPILPPRECTVLSPPGHTAADRLPLVVVLHGFNVEPAALIDAGRWSQAVVRHRIVAVFPHGDFGAWNAGGCCGIPQGTGIDDVGYLQKVIDAAVGDLGVDPARVFMVGVSNGGMMAYRFACDHADELAGIASVVGTDVAGCRPDHPLSLFHLAARDDRTVPYAGGQSLISLLLGVTFPPVERSVSDYAAAVGCTSGPVVDRSGALTTRTWPHCADRARVTLVSVAGADHGWPTGSPIDATTAVLSAFGL